MCKKDLALNDLQRSICHKTKPKKSRVSKTLMGFLRFTENLNSKYLSLSIKKFK